MGFLELFEKTIGPIHFIPGIYPYWVSLLTPIYFRVPSLIFQPSGSQIFGQTWGFRNFLKNYWLNSFLTWHLPLWGEYLHPYIFSCSYPYFRPSGGPIFGRKWDFRNFEKKHTTAKIEIFIFLDEVGSDQSGGILSPLWAQLVLNGDRLLVQPGFWVIF